MVMEKLILFGDYGLDDAAATVSVFKHLSRFSRVWIVPIGGNVPVDISHRNCLTLLSHFPEVWEKVTLVDTRQIPQKGEYLAEIHGGDGMGDILEPAEATPQVETVRFESWLETLDGSETVLSLGPMTLVKPLMARHAHKLIIMGGCVESPPNFGEYEFNHALDPEAFAFCARFPHAAITLDTCRVGVLDMRRYEITGEDIHARILRADQRLSVTRQEEGCFVWDDVAACYLLYPDRFRLREQSDPHGNRLWNAEYISDELYFQGE